MVLTKDRYVPVLADIPITGMAFCTAFSATEIREALKPGTQLNLKRVKDNSADPYAVRVQLVLECDVSSQRAEVTGDLGWIGMKTGHSRKVGSLMDDMAQERYGTPRLCVQQFDLKTSKLTAVLQVPSSWAKNYGVTPLPENDAGPVQVQLEQSSKSADFMLDRIKSNFVIGSVFRLATTPTRVSIDVVDSVGRSLGWFRKEGRNFLTGAAYHARLVSYDPPTVELVPVPPPDEEDMPYMPNTTQHPASNAKAAIAAALAAAREESKPQKETTMTNYAQKFTAIIDANKSAATQAGYLEAGRIANGQAVKLASKHLPLMLRGYASTALGQLVIANIASIAVKQLRPNDATLNQLTEAMAVSAFQEIYQSFDIEGWIDSLTTSEEMKKAISKLPEAGPSAK